MVQQDMNLMVLASGHGLMEGECLSPPQDHWLVSGREFGHKVLRCLNKVLMTAWQCPTPASKVVEAALSFIHFFLFLSICSFAFEDIQHA